MIKRKLIGEKPFEFSARVTLQLGRESISSSTVAISELIKNSYDADADEVTLSFHLRQDATSTLVIEDNGVGMSPDTIFDHWLKIGTDNKATIERSPGKGRVLTGAKGLGRLGIDRLCRKLVLYSKTPEMDDAIQLDLDWRKFENTTKTLSEIKHPIYAVDLPLIDKYGEAFTGEKNSGTRMVLMGLKDDWDENFLESLENELRLLISPFQAENEFSINLKVFRGNEHREKRLSSEKFLSAARWKVRASVDGAGLVSACYTNNQKQLDVIQAPIPWESWLKNSGTKPLFGPIEFEFYYLVQDAANLTKLNLRVKNFREFMRLNQGVRLYRDHFRVRPYGEPSGKGDWLDIGLRKVSSPGGVSQQGWKIGPNQIIGSVLISRETNAILNDQANREGIVENTAFFQLRTFLLKVIETLEVLVHKDVVSDNETDLSGELARQLSKSNEDVEAAIEELKKTVTTISRKKKKHKKQQSPAQLVAYRLHELEVLREKQSQAEQRYLEALQLEKSELEEQKNTLSNLASIGILTISFGHEVRQHSGLALNGSTRALSYLRKVDKEDGQLDDPIECIEIARDAAQYVDNFSRFAIENIKPDKRTRKKVCIHEVFRYVFSIFSATLEKMNIKTEIHLNTVDAPYEVFAFEIDWESIAINLMTNSIWAIESSTNRTNPKIEVNLSEVDSQVYLSYKDSGIGLEADSEERIFAPMNSGKRDMRGNIVGTGMGLAIVKTHVEDHMHGTIKAVAHSDLGGAEFLITIPTTRGASK